MIDQRHLAEYAALAQCIDQAVANVDFDRSVFDNEELRRRVALSENNFARFEVAFRAASPNQEAKVYVRVRHAFSYARPAFFKLTPSYYIRVTVGVKREARRTSPSCPHCSASSPE